MTNSTGNWPPPGSAGGVTAKVRMPGMLLTFACTSGHDLENGALAFAPRLEHQAGKAVVREGDLERLRRLRHAQQLAVDGFGVKGGLVNRRIRRRLDNAHHEALVLRGREFLGRQDEQRDGQQAQDQPDDINRRPGGKRPVQHAAIGPAQAVEAAVDAAR